jgi:hypothetical protein
MGLNGTARTVPPVLNYLAATNPSGHPLSRMVDGLASVGDVLFAVLDPLLPELEPERIDAMQIQDRERRLRDLLDLLVEASGRAKHILSEQCLIPCQAMREDALARWSGAARRMSRDVHCS